MVKCKKSKPQGTEYNIFVKLKVQAIQNNTFLKNIYTHMANIYKQVINEHKIKDSGYL